MPGVRCGWRGRWTAVLLAAVSWASAGAADTGSPGERFPGRLLQGEKAEEARSILKDYSLRRERRSEFRATPQIYDYLFRRLPLASDMIRALAFGKYRIAESAEGGYTIDTGTGVRGKFWVLHDGERRKVLYGDGEYSGWIIRRLGGRAVVLMNYAPGRDGDETVMKNHMTVFVKIDNVVVEFFVKTLDWLIRLLVKKQLADASSSAQRLTEAIAKEPARVYETLRKSPEMEIHKAALEEFRRFFLAGGSPPTPGLPAPPPQ